jgi:hypothetical protein
MAKPAETHARWSEEEKSALFLLVEKNAFKGVDGKVHVNWRQGACPPTGYPFCVEDCPPYTPSPPSPYPHNFPSCCADGGKWVHQI